MPPSAIAFLVILIGGLVALFLGCEFCKCSDEPDEPWKPCYLCHQKIVETKWNSGEHRRECARENADKLESMKKTEVAKCKQCRELLRLWPQMGAEFYCDNNYSCQASSGNSIVNSGINRYNCFLCDIDYCLPCMEKMEKPTKEDSDDDEDTFEETKPKVTWYQSGNGEWRKINLETCYLMDATLA